MARQQSGETKAPLVIALAFFVLSTLVLGVLAYLAYSDMDAVVAEKNEEQKKAAAAATLVETEKGKALLYKIIVGTATDQDRTDFQNLRQEAKDASKAEYAAFQGDLANRLAGAVTDVQKTQFVGGKGQFVDPKNVFVWNQAADGTLDSAPQKPLIDQMVGFYASQQLAQIDAATKQQQAAAAQTAYQQAVAELNTLKDQYQQRINAVPNEVAAQIKAFQDQAKKSANTLGSASKDFQSKLKDLDTDKQRLAFEIKQKEDEIGRLNILRNRLEEEQAAKSDNFQYDRPHGKILSKRGDIVDINLGRSANVREGLTFAIHPSDTPIRGMQSRMRPDGQGGFQVVPKGQLEVIEVMGPNLSRARITQEANSIREAVLIGDLLYNSAWRPGSADHVALFGIFDTNGDGTDDIQQLARQMTKMGVVVDAWYDLSKKEWIGEMTEKTIYAVEGNMPFKNATASGSEAIRAAQDGVRTAIIQARKDALDRGTKLVKMRDFFPRIGMTVNLDVPEDRLNQAASRYLLNAPAAAGNDNFNN